MTRENGDVVDEHVRVGDTLVANRELSDQYRVNTNHRFDIAAGDRLTVTRVYTTTIMVRSIRTYSVRVGYHNERKEVSFSLPRTVLMFEDPNYVPPPPPRKLGRTPSHAEAGLAEDVEIIGYDHPGIQWLWNDMGQYATEKGYCPQYDALCAKLGIPGRPRDFTVRSTIKGLTLTTTIQARSQREANELFKAALAAPEEVSVDEVVLED